MQRRPKVCSVDTARFSGSAHPRFAQHGAGKSAVGRRAALKGNCRSPLFFRRMSMFSYLCGANRKLDRRQRRRSPRLHVEALENRWLPSTAYLAADLVSDLPGVAPITDPHLVNAWGIALNPTSGGFWVSSNGKDLSAIYTGDVNGAALAKASLEVSIPGGAPTGQVFNSTTDFVV